MAELDLTATTTRPDLNDENARHHRNGHLIELRECDWRCLICGHWFDAASDADLFWCGDDCTGRHPGDHAEGWEARAKYRATETSNETSQEAK